MRIVSQRKIGTCILTQMNPLKSSTTTSVAKIMEISQNYKYLKFITCIYSYGIDSQVSRKVISSYYWRHMVSWLTKSESVGVVLVATSKGALSASKSWVLQSSTLTSHIWTTLFPFVPLLTKARLHSSLTALTAC